MKKTLLLVSTLCLALSFTACGGDKKPAAAPPTASEPAKADPAAPADPNAPKPEEKKAETKAGGW